MTHKIVYLILTISLLLIEIGIAIFSTSHFIRSYFGDLLVVILIYCTIKVLVDSEPKRLAIGVFIFSVMIEMAQYFHLVDVLEIKNQILRIIIGTSFSWADILMCFLGCVAIYLIDVFWIRRKCCKLD